MENATYEYPGYFNTSAQQAAAKHNNYYGGKNIINISGSVVDGVIEDSRHVVLIGLNESPPRGYRMAGVKQLVQLLEMQSLPEEWSKLSLHASEVFVDWNVYKHSCIPGQGTPIGKTSFLFEISNSDGKWYLSRIFEGLLYKEGYGFLRDHFRWVCLPE